MDDYVNSPVHRNQLSLKDAGLSEADVGNLRTAVQRNGRFRRLVRLDLTGNVLTGYLEKIMEGLQSHLLRFPYLKLFDLTNTRLSEHDLRYLASNLTPGTLPKLERLNLSENKLRNCMEYFRTLKLPSLKVLFLCSARLTNDDIKSLSAILQNNAATLETLNLFDNILTNSLEDLFPSDQLSLKTLQLRATNVQKSDMECLTRNVLCLEHLDLSDNALNDCTSNLFTSETYAMKTLNLEKTHIIRDDIVNLARGLSQCQNVCRLHLSHNVLTNCMHCILESCGRTLEILELSDTKLDEQDIKCLGEYFRQGKLPSLQELTLDINSFDHSDFENLFGCIVEKSRYEKLQVYLSFKELSEKCRENIKSICDGKQVNVTYRM